MIRTKIFLGMAVIVVVFGSLSAFLGVRLIRGRVVEEAQCGLLVDPLNPKAIAEAIRWLLEHPAEAEEMGKRGQEAIRKHFNWDNEANKLLVLYGNVA